MADQTPAADFEDLLWNLMAPTACDDLKQILRNKVDHRTTPAAAVACLATVIGAEAFVAAAVEAGVLVPHSLVGSPQTYRIGGDRG